jgi:lipopolysaccharide transport system permease protein
VELFRRARDSRESRSRVNRQLLTKLYVPRIILPLAQMSAGVVSRSSSRSCCSGRSLITARRMASGMQPNVRLLAAWHPSPLCSSWLLLSLRTSIWQARARDARFVVRYVLAFWLYFTPVIYPLSVVPADIRWLVYLNPVTAPVETFKWGMLPGMQHSWPWFGYAVVIALTTFIAGVWYFVRSENATMDKL